MSSPNDCMSALPNDDPMMIAWNAYKRTEDFANTLRWATDARWVGGNAEHAAGQLWGAFVAGFQAAVAIAIAKATER